MIGSGADAALLAVASKFRRVKTQLTPERMARMSADAERHRWNDAVDAKKAAKRARKGR